MLSAVEGFTREAETAIDAAAEHAAKEVKMLYNFTLSNLPKTIRMLPIARTVEQYFKVQDYVRGDVLMQSKRTLSFSLRRNDETISVKLDLLRESGRLNVEVIDRTAQGTHQYK
jgi:hypothetical protein